MTFSYRWDDDCILGARKSHRIAELYRSLFHQFTNRVQKDAAKPDPLVGFKVNGGMRWLWPYIMEYVQNLTCKYKFLITHLPIPSRGSSLAMMMYAPGVSRESSSSPQ